MTQEKWGQLRQELISKLGQNNYKTWIEPLEFSDLRDGTAVFKVPTNFMGNYVSRNFSDVILGTLSSSGERVSRLAFEVAANSTTRPSARRGGGEAQHSAGAHAVLKENDASQGGVIEALQTAPLDARFTFDSPRLRNQRPDKPPAAFRIDPGGVIRRGRCRYLRRP